jgi:hypothetical protein
MTPEWAQIVVALITLIGVGITVYHSSGSHKNSRQTNDAVNHIHGTGKERLYDLVLGNTSKLLDVKSDTDELVAWKKGYDETPWNNGDGVKDWLEKHQEEIQEIKAEIKYKKEP